MNRERIEKGRRMKEKPNASTKVNWEVNYTIMIYFRKKKTKQKIIGTVIWPIADNHVTHYTFYYMGFTYFCFFIYYAVKYRSIVFHAGFWCISFSLHILRKGSMSILCIEKPLRYAMESLWCCGFSCTVGFFSVIHFERIETVERFWTSCGSCSTNWWQNASSAYARTATQRSHGFQDVCLIVL